MSYSTIRTGNPSQFPTGTVTFLFTDIEGSTQLAQAHPQEMPALLARHNTILSQAIEAHHGFVFRIVGDSFSAAFTTAIEALSAALEAQRRLQTESWSPAPIRVRMGIHTGAAKLKDAPAGAAYEGYATLALTQRIMSVGHGGQILLSQTTHDLVDDGLPDGTELRDMGKRRLKDIVRPEHIYQVAASDLQSEFPSLTTLDAVNHNLPAQLTSFVGREGEITAAREALSSTRLLTFIGPGGTGKTRLSLEVAALHLPEFKDGVWLVELSQLAESAYVLPTIASVFRLREQQGVPLIEYVTDYLRAKQLLLVLDNCEHLIETCAQLAEHFLQNCPKLRVMASSREALGIPGEAVYRVPSLSLPPNMDAVQDVTELAHEIMRYEAPRLFSERATRTNPQFRLTTNNAPYVVQICQRLDGIPLAIELAASRVNIFTPQQIAERLDDRFRLLTGGSRTALPRQQTLRALIDWSYLTLNETEQYVLRCLAVFSGGWSFEAAESVAGPLEAMDGLSGLVNKSLANVERHDSESRYRYLETIRQYALEKLLESGDAVKTRNRHLAYFLELSRRAEENFGSPQRLLWLNRLELEHDNIRSALGWALEHDAESALQMAGSLATFWLSRTYLREGCRWCQAALSASEASPPTGRDVALLRARAYTALATLSINRGDHHTGRGAAGQAVGLAREFDDPLQLARALNYLGLSFAFLGNDSLAFDNLRESEALCRKFGYKDDLASVLQSLAYVTMEIHGPGAGEEMRSYMEESLALSKRSVDPEAAVRIEGILSRLAFHQGDLAEARRHADLMLELHRELGDQHSVTGHQSEMAHVARQIGNYEEALALYRETLPDWQKMGHRGAVAHQLECVAFIAKAREDGPRALKLMGAAEALREISSSARTPQEQLEYVRELEGLQAVMDEKAFKLLWEEGQSMDMDQAIAFAMGEHGD